MGKNFLINCEEQDSIAISPLDLIQIKDRLEPKNSCNDEYEFNETDSHVTEMVKDYCDSDDCFSDIDALEKLNFSFEEVKKPPMTKTSNNSFSTFESMNSPPRKLLKLSSIYKEFKEGNIAEFKIDLFKILANGVFPYGTNEEQYWKTVSETKNFQQSERFSKFSNDDIIKVSNRAASESKLKKNSMKIIRKVSLILEAKNSFSKVKSKFNVAY
jgi:hypothetical protein